MAFLSRYITALFNYRRISVLFVCFAIGLSLAFAAFAEPDKTTVYFYSSETNINNFKSLKMEFDKYLSRFGTYEFQPFSNREDFGQHNRGLKKQGGARATSFGEEVRDLCQRMLPYSSSPIKELGRSSTLRHELKRTSRAQKQWGAR